MTTAATNTSTETTQTNPAQGQASANSAAQTTENFGITTPSNGSTAPEMFDVKVNGKTIKMTRQELLDNASMSYAANDKFTEAKSTRKEVDRIISTAKSNPMAALMDPVLGLSKEQVKDAFEKWYAKEFIEPETLTPQQRREKHLEEENRGYKEREENEKKARETEASQRAEAHERENLQKDIIKAMDESGLPKSKYFLSRIAHYMRHNLTNGWDAPMSTIVSQVKAEYRQMNSHIVSKDATVEQILELFGEDVVNKIRKWDLQKLRAGRNIPGSSLGSPSPSQVNYDNQPKGKIDYSTVNENLRKLKAGKI